MKNTLNPATTAMPSSNPLGLTANAAGIMWKKAPPIREPAAKATNGNSRRSSVAGFSTSVTLPINAMALISSPPTTIPVNAVIASVSRRQQRQQDRHVILPVRIKAGGTYHLKAASHYIDVNQGISTSKYID
jgi:hypothetical protein